MSCREDLCKKEASTSSPGCEARGTPLLNTCIELPVSDELLEEIVIKAKDYALLHGAGMRFKANYDSDILQMAPFFLLPSSFPRQDFEQVVALQPIINKLMHRIAYSHEFLEKCLRNTIKVDEFTAKLWNIYKIVYDEGFSQFVSVGLFRCDYFFCCSSTSTKQVEINTIASSFAALSTKVGLLHRYVLGELRKPDLLSRLPKNEALSGLCQGMLKAFDVYSSPKAVILFIVEDVSYNICDQRFHEYNIRELRPEVYVIRRTLTEMFQNGSLTVDKRLMIDELEVGVVYFRCGYEPNQFPSENEWAARLMIERSKAVKCPSIQYHLAGTKKVQQEVARQGVLHQFLSEDEALQVQQHFTGLYTLDQGPEGDDAIEMALKDPHKFVLKPQREGGGNNIYGEDIKLVLEEIKDTKDREAYILMDRIFPPIQKNYLVRSHQPAILSDVVSELGIFGVCLGNGQTILENSYAGHMLRTKFSDVNEGGVAAGHGALDSVFLID